MDMVLSIVIGIIVGILIDMVLFAIWHSLSHKNDNFVSSKQFRIEMRKMEAKLLKKIEGTKEN